ncbi:DegT/DnrJ/EryC1/StrS family aminotransferase [Salinarimonas chemoclinalis]|uniref:DegT/DnrJ/EryC1/StrS family aminotransferase n=1 Tax=Salinarimonas chemoclinalis TaxID=3241599 RepID=UPI0035572B98
MNVQRYDYAAQFAGIGPAVRVALEAALLGGNYILGPEVATFEGAFADFCGVRHCVGVNSGTDALILALRACGIGPGDRVAVQANTFFATVAAISLVGATPVLVDACPQTYLIDLERLAASGPVDAILPVHLYGLATDMDRLNAIARSHEAIVIEDCAQAHGARHGARPVGGFGRVGCFSFHPSKNLAAAGDAGGCVTDDPAIDERLRLLRHLGQSEQNTHNVVASNSRLDVLQSIVLRAKLPALEAWNRRRAAIAEIYRRELSDLPIGFQSPGSTGAHVYHLFQLETSERDALVDSLTARGVDATVRYPTPIHLQPAFADLGHAPGDFPVAERLARTLLCLPIRPDMSDVEVDCVIDAVRRHFHEGRSHVARD